MYNDIYRDLKIFFFLPIKHYRYSIFFLCFYYYPDKILSNSRRVLLLYRDSLGLQISACRGSCFLCALFKWRIDFIDGMLYIYIEAERERESPQGDESQKQSDSGKMSISIL